MRTFIIFLAFIASPHAFSQPSNYFPIRIDDPGGWENLDVQNEKAYLSLLNINTIFIGQGDQRWWYDNICDSNVRLISFEGPNNFTITSEHLWFGHIFGEWVYGNYLSGWGDTVKNHLNDIYTNYVNPGGEWENQLWYGLYFDECNWSSGSYWTENQWDSVFMFIKYAHDYWKDRLNVPVFLKNRFIYSMPVLAIDRDGEAGENITKSNFSDHLIESGVSVVESECFFFEKQYPPTNFDSVQHCLIKTARSADSCLEYFDRGDTLCWYAYVYSAREDTATWHYGKKNEIIYDGHDVYRRWLTKEELRAQAWIQLSRGAKGINYYRYFSDPEDTIKPTQKGFSRGFGLLDHDRIPRDSAHFFNNPQYDGNSAKYRIYDWVREINDTISIIGPFMAEYNCKDAFSVDTIDGEYSQASYIKKFCPVPSQYAQYGVLNYFEIGCFKNKTANNDTDVFMVVNRYCFKEDTVTVVPKLHYRYPYYLFDVLNNTYISGKQKPSRDTTLYDSTVLFPGGGRVIKVVPDTQTANYHLCSNISNVPFKEFYSVGEITAENSIIDSSNIRLTSEDGSITISSNFTLQAGSTLLAQVVPHIDSYYSTSGKKHNNISQSMMEGASQKRIEKHESGEVPNNAIKFILHQNVPNPCDGFSTIKYGLPEKSLVNLKIFNIAGQAVKSYDLGVQGPGFHEINSSIFKLSKGVYFYNLRAGKYSSIKKMIIL